MLIRLITFPVMISINGCFAHRTETFEIPPPPSPSTPSKQVSNAKKVKTCFYAQSLNGQKTVSGEIYRSEALTATHRTYPFGSKLRLTNQKNGKSVVVRVNDRGPHVAGRELDISSSAAKAPDITTVGVADLEIQLLPAST